MLLEPTHNLLITPSLLSRILELYNTGNTAEIAHAAALQLVALPRAKSQATTCDALMHIFGLLRPWARALLDRHTQTNLCLALIVKVTRVQAKLNFEERVRRVARNMVSSSCRLLTDHGLRICVVK